MLFTKGLGIALLLALALGTSILFARFERAKCLQAEGFVDLIRNVRLQIDCFATPITGE